VKVKTISQVLLVEMDAKMPNELRALRVAEAVAATEERSANAAVAAPGSGGGEDASARPPCVYTGVDA
jgi:hypothetical protein